MKKWLKRIFCFHKKLVDGIIVTDYKTGKILEIAPRCQRCGKLFNYFEIKGIEDEES